MASIGSVEAPIFSGVVCAVASSDGEDSGRSAFGIGSGAAPAGVSMRGSSKNGTTGWSAGSASDRAGGATGSAGGRSAWSRSTGARAGMGGGDAGRCASGRAAGGSGGDGAPPSARLTDSHRPDLRPEEGSSGVSASSGCGRPNRRSGATSGIVRSLPSRDEPRSQTAGSRGPEPESYSVLSPYSLILL